MRLHEIYEGFVRFQTVRSIADRILGIEKDIKWNGGCKEEDWNWLQLKCEDEALLKKLSSEASRFSNFNRMDYGDGEMLTTASNLARDLLLFLEELIFEFIHSIMECLQRMIKCIH